MKKELEQVIDEEEFDSIVLYQLPYKSERQIILGSSEKVFNGINEHHLISDGFVFDPFDNTSSGGLFINSHYTASFQKLSDKQKELLGNQFITSPESDAKVHEDDFNSYMQHFNKMHKAIQDKKLTKVILSRTHKGPQIKHKQIISLFEALADTYPHAFVYAISSPDCGTWIGAGPELLLKHRNGILSTVSLAGTLPNDKQQEWTQKEFTEQQLVTEYVESVLLHNQVDNIEYTVPQTVSAGQVKHLQTTFSFEIDKINGNHIGLLYDLHPTPAVCGLPKEDAFQLILETEKHDRQYYCGFLGPVANGQYEFYVNIRCLQIITDESILYIGGGLTNDSQAEKEWHETELKAETLLSVLKNI